MFLMSSGRSSQLAACFSVERTKYLMLSKSIPEDPHPTPASACGRTTAGPSAAGRASIPARSSWPRCRAPRLVEATAGRSPRPSSASAQPYSYRPRAASCSAVLLPPRPGPSSGSSLLGHRSALSTGCCSSLLGCLTGWECAWCTRRHRGDGGQTLHVRADQAGDDLGLGLAQLGKLGGDLRHRAVVLAQLPAGGDRRRVGSVTLRRSAPARVPRPAPSGRRWPRWIAPRQRSSRRGHLLGRERRRPRRHRRCGAIQRSAEVASCRSVWVPHAAAAGLGQREHLRRPPPAALAEHVLLPADHVTVGEQHVQVLADRGRAQPEASPSSRSRGRHRLQQQSLDPRSRTAIAARCAGQRTRAPAPPGFSQR